MEELRRQAWKRVFPEDQAGFPDSENLRKVQRSVSDQRMSQMFTSIKKALERKLAHVTDMTDKSQEEIYR